MKYKYIILDFGKVLAYPITGSWFITDYFLRLIREDNLSTKLIEDAMNRHNDIISRKAATLEEEYDIFYDFYKRVFEDINYKYTDDILKQLTYSFVYSKSKYKIYDDVKDSLEKLSKKVKLIMLSDNWPCGIEIMDEYNLDSYFTKMYISSVYGSTKKEGTIFDYPIKEFNIKPGDALFIDDNEEILDVAYERGFDVKIMMRDTVVKSKYERITSLYELLD